MLDIPGVVVERAGQLGAPGRQWLARLDHVVAELESRWSITVGPALPGGTAAYAARARTAGGQDAVLKLSVPDPDLARQVETLTRAQGRGYCRVLQRDAGENAVLLELLGPSLDLLRPAPERSIDILCRTLQSAWQLEPWPALAVGRPLHKAAQLRGLIEWLWVQLNHPCPESVIDMALRFTDRRAQAFGRRPCVVVHGDPHPGNAVQVLQPRAGAESGFVFVDPDGFLEDPAYDLGVILRGWCGELLAGDAPALARAYCRRLSDRTGIDEQAIWEWGFIERVSSGLYLLQLGQTESGRQYLDAAHRLTHPV